MHMPRLYVTTDVPPVYYTSMTLVRHIDKPLGKMQKLQYHAMQLCFFHAYFT